jgi:predicted CoA-binding protein
MVAMSGLSYTLKKAWRKTMKENDIAGILTSTRPLRWWGSDKPDRPSYRVMKYLLDQGYHVIPVRRKLPEKHCWGSRAMPRWQMCRKKWIW